GARPSRSPRPGRFACGVHRPRDLHDPRARSAVPRRPGCQAEAIRDPLRTADDTLRHRPSTMIIRRLERSHQLITQPDHAALACRIMRAWDADLFPETVRKPSILHAVEQHDNGWAGIDRSLVIDDKTGQLLDFIRIPTPLKLETSRAGIESLASDPYA